MTVRGRSTRGELLPMWHLPSSRKESSSCWVAQRRSSNQWLEESLWRDPVDWACNSRPIHVPADWVLVSPPAAVPCRRWPESSNVAAAAATAWLVSRKKLYEREWEERTWNQCVLKAGRKFMMWIYCAIFIVRRPSFAEVNIMQISLFHDFTNWPDHRRRYTSPYQLVPILHTCLELLFKGKLQLVQRLLNTKIYIWEPGGN